MSMVTSEHAMCRYAVGGLAAADLKQGPILQGTADGICVLLHLFWPHPGPLLLGPFPALLPCTGAQTFQEIFSKVQSINPSHQCQLGLLGIYRPLLNRMAATEWMCMMTSMRCRASWCQCPWIAYAEALNTQAVRHTQQEHWDA